jgi:hypothetical protein
MSAVQQISPNTVLQVPPAIAVCPYCQTALTVSIEACTQEADGWVATEIQVDCETEPDLETDQEAWHAWMEHHTQMPYVYLLPVHQRVLRWLEQHYRFVVDEPPAAEEGGGR